MQTSEKNLIILLVGELTLNWVLMCSPVHNKFWFHLHTEVNLYVVVMKELKMIFFDDLLDPFTCFGVKKAIP